MDKVANRIADYIRRELGQRACMMLGAKDFVVLVQGLQFTIRSNPKGVVRILIQLELNDTYSLKFYGRKNPRTWEMPLKASVAGVRESELHRIIEVSTGLSIKLASV